MTSFSARDNGTSRVIFLGFLGSPDEIKAAFATETTPQWSAINFQNALLGALAEAGASTYVIGTLPVASFPRNRLFFAGSRRRTGETMSLLNLPGIRLLWRLFVAFGHLLSAVGRNDDILVYSLHTPLLVAALLVARHRGVRIGVVIPDLPMFMNSGARSPLRDVLKSLDDRLLKWLARKADVVFPITQAIAQDWLGRADRFAVVEGIAPTEMQPFRAKNPSVRPVLLYAGNFGQVYQCVEMFHRNSVDAQLVLAGGGPERERLEALAAQDDRITIKKFMPPGQLKEEVDAATFLINLRSTSWSGGMYSFPSKLIEYIRFGKPVISTRLRGIPDEYFDHFHVLDDSNDASFALSLGRAVSATLEEVERSVAGAQSMLQQQKSPEAVGQKIIKALRGD